MGQRGECLKPSGIYYLIKSYAYDGRGNRILELDELGNRTTYVYDGNSRLRRMINAVGAITTYEYNAMGAQTGLIDPEISIPADAQAVNQISNEMVRGQPPVGTVLPRFIDFLDGT